MVKQIGFYDRANTLHFTSVLASVDAEQCYDAVNHTYGSVALQAHGVPAVYAVLYLSTIAYMVFHLKTGFGRDAEGFGGTACNPMNGLAQGSGASPSTWSNVSSLMVSAYKRKGYGVNYTTAWSELVFVIAAILFVDDCDLLHMCCDPNIPEMEFLERVQHATYYWAKLLQATGGMLKESKCFWYLLSYKFVHGEAKLRRLRELPHYELVIPQHSGVDAVIKLLDVGHAAETLGVFTSPLSDPNPARIHFRRTQQLQKLVDKGLD